MSYANPTVADFKLYFPTDFPYGTDPQSEVTDSAIQKALDETSWTINDSLFMSQNQYSAGYNYLSAHFLVNNLKNSGSGCAGQELWLVSSKGVGGVSESFTIPQRILDNPYFAWLSKTTYGLRYLMMILPLLSGQIMIIDGETTS